MSFLGFRKPSSEEKIAQAEAEVKMMADMHNRMSKICMSKCVAKDYREGELNKGESVCLDRCAAKFFEAHQKVAELMAEQQQQAMRGGAGGAGATGGGRSGFGFGG